MSANFDPSMGNYKNMTPFKMWCQKVLPQTYDDSLSYYEVLCKLKNHLNEVIENMDVLHDDVDALHVAYQQLEAYVNNYFDNLSVQTEINNKLDDMAEDGSLSELIAPFVETLLPDEVAERIESVVALQLGAVVTQQLGAVVSEQLPAEVATQVPTMVTAWLNDHVNPESEVIIDDSLTIKGAAADAKATGDAVGELKSALTNAVVNGFESACTAWEYGDINNDGTLNHSGTGNFVIPSDYITFSEDTTVFINIGIAYQVKAALFDSQGNFISAGYVAKNQYSFIKGTKVAFAVRANPATNSIKIAPFVILKYTQAKKNDRIQKFALAQKNTNDEPFAFTTDFYFGVMSAGEVIYTNQKRTFSGMLKYAHPVSIKSADGFRFYIEYYDANEDYSSESGMLTDVTISANTNFRICVAYNTPEPSTDPDIDVLKTKVYFYVPTVINSVYDTFAPMTNGKMRLIAHMGWHNEYVVSNMLRNALPSFINAGVHKCFGCETDIRETVDGHFVCLHDDDVSLWTNGEGNVSEMTLAEIEALYLMEIDGVTVSSEKIPTLEQYLTVCKQYNMIGFMELKAVSSVQAFLSVLSDYGMQNQSVLMTNRLPSITLRSYTDIPLVMMLSNADDTASINQARLETNVIIGIDKQYVTGDFVKQVHGYGMPVSVWTPNTKEEVDILYGYGVDFITSDGIHESDYIVS